MCFAFMIIKTLNGGALKGTKTWTFSKPEKLQIIKAVKAANTKT